jgi:hypothetical protein
VLVATTYMLTKASFQPTTIYTPYIHAVFRPSDFVFPGMIAR